MFVLIAGEGEKVSEHVPKVLFTRCQFVENRRGTMRDSLLLS